MVKVIMVGCDLHQRTIVLRYSVGEGAAQRATFVNDVEGRAKMLAMLQELARREGARRIVFVYEASSLGYGLCDFLFDAGIECHVLSPTHLPKSSKQARQKTDDKDAQMLLELVRGYVLAGNSLPVIWTPPQRLRDDRELVRCRVDTADECSRVKLQILSLLKRRGLVVPERLRNWPKAMFAWLRSLAQGLDSCVAPVLRNLVDRLEMNQRHLKELDQAVKELSETDRYRGMVNEVRKLPGVGLLTAMTFLTELGDLTRFQNRREVAAYLGLCPASYESGETSDRKGHITRQGPSRVRKLLCQATWVGVGRCEEVSLAYDRLRHGKKNQGKKALVALMRKLAIRMWHRALAMGVSSELIGRGGPHACRATGEAA